MAIRRQYAADMMNWSLPALALRRPVTVVMLTIALLSVGIIAGRMIQTEFIMPMDFPIIRCYVPYPGATPAQVEAEVAIPVEGEFRTIEHLERIHTRSDGGGCYIRMWFNWGTDMAVAVADVRDRMDRVKHLLPQEADRLFLRRYSSATMPVLRFILYGAQDDEELAHWARTQMRPRLMRRPGVAEVTVSGSSSGTVYVEFDQKALKSANLSLYDVIRHLEQSKIKISAGEIYDGKTSYLVRLVNDYVDPEQLGGAIVGPNGLRLRDVARVHLPGMGTGSNTTIDSKRGIFVSILKESEANTIVTCDAVKSELDSLRADPIMRGVQLFVYDDHSANIQSAIGLLSKAGKKGGALAMLVLLVFMRRLRATMIIGSAIPLSIVGGLIYIYFAGMTLNTVTMAAMIICVGLLVDNSVVVMENILRYRDLGYGQIESTRRGANEVGLAITASTLTTVVVFVPVFYMEAGEMSIYMREFSVPVTVSLLTSLAVSLTIIPLAAKGMRPRPPVLDAVLGRHRAVLPVWLGHLHPVYAFMWAYRLLLAWTMRRRFAACVGLCALVLATFLIPYQRVGMQRLPTVDWRRVDVNVHFDQGYDWPSAQQVFQTIEDLIEAQRAELAIQHVYVSPGSGGGQVRAYLQAADGGGRDHALYSTDEVSAILKTQLSGLVPGGEVTVDVARAPEIEGQRIAVRLRGPSSEVLADYARRFKVLFASLPDVTDVATEAEHTSTEIQLEIDETLATQAGISPYAIALTVDFALRGRRLFYLNTKRGEIPVRARFQASDRQHLGNLDNVALRGNRGMLVALNRLVSKRKADTPRAIDRFNGKNVVSVSATVTTKDLGSVKRELETLIAAFDLPAGYDIETGESLSELETSMRSFSRALVMAVILIYLVMGALFESCLLPLSILSSVPLAFVGVYWVMYLAGLPMDAVALIGAILMCGVVVNNGIVLVDYINQLRRQGRDRIEAILQAGHDRFRPVMMTALTTILGCVPLAMGSRVGEVAFDTLGVTLIGGLSTGTLLTLFVVPLFYSLIDDLQGWFKNYGANLADLGQWRTAESNGRSP